MTKNTTPVSAASTAIANRAARTPRGKKNAGAIAALAATVTKGQTPEEINASMAQAQAKQTAADKVAYDARPNSAVSAGVAPAPAPAPIKPLGIRFAMPAVRPASGSLLAAHTAVFLRHSGMMGGAAIPSAVVRTVMGDTAIAYHMREGNFASVRDERDESGNVTRAGGLIVTTRGLEVFGKRKVQGELESAFESVLCFGKVDERTGNKNASLIVQIAK